MNFHENQFFSYYSESRNQKLRIQVRYRKGPLSQKSAGHMQNRKTKNNTDPNRYRRRCPDPNARIQKFIHYMAIATFAIADLCDSGPLPYRTVTKLSLSSKLTTDSFTITSE